MLVMRRKLGCLTHLKLDVPSWVAQHILLSLEVLQGVSVQAEEALVPLLVEQPSKPGAWTLTILAQVTAHH